MTNNINKARIGDTIKCNGRTVIISDLIESYHYETGWIIEGYDQNGKYFIWKQYFDGGKYIPKPDKYRFDTVLFDE